MSIENKIVLPHFVRILAWQHDAWLVGSTARKLVLGEDVSNTRDWDMLVPIYEWPKACLLVPPKTRANSFGGFKVTDHHTEAEIDMWAGDVGWFLDQSPEMNRIFALHLKTGTYLEANRQNRRSWH